MPRRLVTATVAALIFLAPCTAIADEGASTDTPPEPMPGAHLVLKTGDGELETKEGRRFLLPVGTHVLDGTAWAELDLEYRRLQDVETRLTAENASLRASASEWRPGWRTLLVVFAVGAAGGVYAASRF